MPRPGAPGGRWPAPRHPCSPAPPPAKTGGDPGPTVGVMGAALPLRKVAALAAVPGAFDDQVGVDHPLLVIDLDDADGVAAQQTGAIARALAALPVVTVGVASGAGAEVADLVDVVVHDRQALDRVESTV